MNAPKERPILFNADMVRAILNVKKTQTRRVMKPQPYRGRYGDKHPTHPNGVIGPLPGSLGGSDYHVWQGPHATAPLTIDAVHVALRQCPYGKPGDLLWVRETWAVGNGYDGMPPRSIPQVPFVKRHYAATENRGELLWRPSIHMPRWMSRITLRITDVRVQRLQDISEDDAHAEGVTHKEHGGSTAREGFQRLWESINGNGAWAGNPWVWAMTFERVKP